MKRDKNTSPWGQESVSWWYCSDIELALSFFFSEIPLCVYDFLSVFTLSDKRKQKSTCKTGITGESRLLVFMSVLAPFSDQGPYFYSCALPLPQIQKGVPTISGDASTSSIDETECNNNRLRSMQTLSGVPRVICLAVTAQTEFLLPFSSSIPAALVQLTAIFFRGAFSEYTFLFYFD